MADAAKILFALGLPFLTGALFVMALSQTRRPGYWSLVAGLALPLGLVSIIGGYLVIGNWGSGLNFGSNVAIQLGSVAVLAALVWLRWSRWTKVQTTCWAADSKHELSPGSRWLISLVLAWLALRWAGIFLEVAYRPLFPWDAWSAYGMQAKVWYFQSNFEQFETGMRWFQVDGPTWTAGRSWNPPGIGLIQLWSLQALGHYDDALMNLAWPLAMAGTGLVLFGTLRMVGGSLLVAIGAVAAVLTLPVLNTQAVLAGYGDIWIGLFLLLAISGGVLARAFGPRWLLVTGVAAAGMLMIKETSVLWMPVLALGLLAGWMRFRWILLLAVLGFLGFCAFLWIYGDPIRVSTLGRLGFGDDGFVWPAKINLDAWREIVMWPALLRHLFVYPNWHLFWFLVPVVVLASCWYALRARVFAMMAVVTWGGLTLLLGFFSFSTLGNAVLDGTSVNRLLLHLVPAMGLLGGLVVLRWQGRLILELRT